MSSEEEMSIPTSSPNPAIVMQQNLAFATARSLHTAIDLAIFTKLSGNPLTSDQLSKLLATNAPALDKLLSVLAMTGFLEKANGVFSNSATAEALLVQGKPGYMGPLIEQGKRIWNGYNDLTAIIKTGKPTEQSKSESSAAIANDQAAARTFAYAMHGIALGVAQQLVQAVDLSDYKSLLDIGGGAGTHSIFFAQANPHLRATVLELPNVVGVAQETIESYGLSDRVSAISENWTQGPLRSGFDVMLMSQVLHIEKTEESKKLLRKAFEALPSGGLLITMHFLMDAGKTSPWFPVVFNLNMLVELGTQGFSTVEMQEYLHEAGFVDIKTIPLAGPQTIVTGRKP